MSTQVELARQHWEEGFRRFQSEAGEPRRHAALWDQLEVLTSELRRRVGATYTLAQLARDYAGVESWALEALEHSAIPGWQRSASLVTDAAFHLYARGAQDYRP